MIHEDQKETSVPIEAKLFWSSGGQTGAKMMIEGKTIGCEITIDEAKSIRRWLKFGWDELRRIIQTELRKVG